MYTKSVQDGKIKYTGRLMKFLTLPVKTRFNLIQVKQVKVSKQRTGYVIESGAQSNHILVDLRGKLTRKLVVELITVLEARSQKGHFVQINLHQVQNLDMKGFASLAMVCATLEQKDVSTRLSGVPRKLQQMAFEARLHHLVSFE